MKISSDFALLDVKAGRKALAKEFDNQSAPTSGKRIAVTITGFITGIWGDDDGTSQEFNVDVTGVQLGETVMPESN